MSRFEDRERDRNFDDLAERFSRNVYASLKGKIRLGVLRRDLFEMIPDLAGVNRLSILDAGAGQGHFGLDLARLGHHVVLNDISTQMLAFARRKVDAQPELADNVEFLQQPLQNLPKLLPPGRQFDLVLCHAVIEWLAEPGKVFDSLMPLLKPGGCFSILFYNFHGMEFKNLLRMNFSRFNPDAFKPSRGSLTPIHPHTPEQITQWVQHHGLELMCKSGVRVFHDYILDRTQREQQSEELLRKELEYSRKEPFWRLGRYVHFLCRKPR